jgi:translocation protein SEC62
MAAKKPEWDQTFEPVIKVLLSKKGVKTKSASEIGKKKVDYFRGKDFKKFALGSDELLKKKCPAALKALFEGKPPASDKEAEMLGAELLMKGFIYKAAYQSNVGSSDKKPPKWPDRVQRTQKQDFELDGFYCLAYEGSKGWQYFMTGLIIFCVLAGCMFRVWPMWAKIGIWYLSVIFLTFYFGILILRMIMFTLFWIVGFDFWIFPNINDDSCGFLETFQPLYSWEKRKDDAMMLIIRFLSLAITAVAVQQIAETHSLADIQDFVHSSYADVLDWGVEKLTALPGTEQRQMLPDLKDLEEQLKADEKNESAATLSATDVAPEADADDDDVVEVDAPPKKEL